MILTSCPAVSWPIRYDAEIMQDREQDEVVQHLVADRLLEDVVRDQADDARHHPSGMNRPAGGVARRAATCSTKKSSSVERIGFNEMKRPPRARSVGDQALGLGLGRQLDRVAARRLIRVDAATSAPDIAAARARSRSRHHQFPPGRR